MEGHFEGAPATEEITRRCIKTKNDDEGRLIKKQKKKKRASSIRPKFPSSISSFSREGEYCKYFVHIDSHISHSSRDLFHRCKRTWHRSPCQFFFLLSRILSIPTSFNRWCLIPSPSPRERPENIFIITQEFRFAKLISRKKKNQNDAQERSLR